MSISDWVKLVLPLATLVLAGVGGYYDLKAEVTLQSQLLTQRIEQETKGYAVLQQSLGASLRGLQEELVAVNRKLDCLSDKRFCR